MKITDKKTGSLTIELTMEIEAADYAPIEKKKVAERRRNAEFKGFRKGMVPESLVRRVYGDQILADTVNHVVSEGLDNYIKSNSLKVLGEPIASENQPENTWESGQDFKFVFDIALQPEVKVAVEKADTVVKYEISASAKDKAAMVENLKKFYEGRKEEKSAEDIETEVTGRLASEYAQESEWRLSKDIRDYFVKKAAVELPEDFLKRWLLQANEGKVSAEDVEKEFPGFIEDFRWQMVRGTLMKEWGFKVEDKDVQEAAEAYVAYQYAMYGMGNVPAEILKESVQNVLTDRRQVERLIEQVEDRKVMDKIRSEITLKSKKITSEKFREL